MASLAVKLYKDFQSIRCSVSYFLNCINNCPIMIRLMHRIPITNSFNDISEEAFEEAAELLIEKVTAIERKVIFLKGDPRIIGGIYHAREKENDIGENFSGREHELHNILSNITTDIDFARESVNSRLILRNKDVELILIGRPDKISRCDKHLLILDDKYSPNIFDYKYKKCPDYDHLFQVLIYLNSEFSVSYRPTIEKIDISDIPTDQTTLDHHFGTAISNNGNYNSRDWFKIPHRVKVWVVNIRDSDNNGDIAKTFYGILDKDMASLLLLVLLQFTGMIFKNRKDNIILCRSSCLVKCPFENIVII